MKSVLLSKLKNLVRGDDGAALVITLGVFFFMYIFCAGVYAIGFAVKERIQLQNACDAAAYSAAVVQADTISRIATLNRAMGWTYAQMCRRQMDYIMYRWLEHTVDHHWADEQEAAEWTNESKGKPHRDGEVHHGAYDISSITLYTQNAIRSGYSRKGLTDIYRGSDVYPGLEKWIKTHCQESMYGTSKTGIEGLEEQIYADKKAIRKMNEAYDAYIDGLPTNVENAVSAILRANIPAYMDGQCLYMIKQELNPNRNLFEPMRNTEADERTLVKWGDGGWIDECESVGWDKRKEGMTVSWEENGWRFGERRKENYEGPFGPGSMDGSGWYVRTGEYYDGIQREYSGNLRAEWTWWAWYCAGCNDITPPNYQYHKKCCRHAKTQEGKSEVVDALCRCSENGNSTEPPGKFYRHSSWTYADSSHLMKRKGYKGEPYEYYYTGQRAFPRKLRRSYFDKAGTITVGLMRRNTNPFYAVFQSAMQSGFYSAFRPYNDWTWCFSSAKAGYKLYELPEEETADRVDNLGWEARYNGRPKAFNGPRDYCVDWKEPRSLRSIWVLIYKDHYKWIDPVVIDDVVIREGYWVHDWKQINLETEARVENYRRNHQGPDEYVIVKEGSATEPMQAGGKPERIRYETLWRQSWNLTQSDWDAVLLPVRQGLSYASETNTHSHLEWMRSIADRKKLYSYEPVWQERKDAAVRDLIDYGQWKDFDGNVSRFLLGLGVEMYAGGEHDPDPNGDWGDDFIDKTSASWSGWWDIPKTAADHPEDLSKKVQSRWNIGTPHGKLKWKDVTKLMFH